MARPLPLRTLRPLFRKKELPVPFKQFARYNGTVQIQNVRVRRRIFTVKRLITAALYTGVSLYSAAMLFDALFVVEKGEVEDEEDGNQNKEGVPEESRSEEDEEEEWEGDEDALFIPLTWAKPMPRTYYKGTDPEWQEFIKFAKDQDRMKRARATIVEEIWKGMFAGGGNHKILGKPVTGQRRYWLQVIYPDGPPQEYERIGLEIGEGYIALCARTVSTEVQSKLKDVLWPASTFRAVWATGTYITQMQLFRLKQILGIESEPPLPGSPSAQLMQRRVAMDTRRRNLSGSASRPNEVARESLMKDLPFAGSPALLTFLGNRTASSQKNMKQVPRGMVAITGLVEVRGSKGAATVDTLVHYDPKAAKIVAMRLDMRTYLPSAQSPRG